jgi:DNA-binding transcriptional ArsR family regulator
LYTAGVILPEPRFETDLSSVAALMGEPARAAMLCALMDGVSLPAGELAELAGVSPQTASTHLQKLLEGELVAVESHGRHRYYRLSNPEVAAALEALMVIAPQPRKRASKDEALCFARTCYDHLAGWTGVELTRALTSSGCLERDAMQFNLTPTGWARLEAFGLDVETLALQRNFAKACLDWTERKPHLGGALGRALTARFFELNWIVRLPTSRSLRITQAGHVGLEKTFGMRL